MSEFFFFFNNSAYLSGCRVKNGPPKQGEKVAIGSVTSNSFGEFDVDELVTQVSTGTSAYVYSWNKADNILIGGGMAFPFIKFMGGKIGGSLCKHNEVEVVKKFLFQAKKKWGHLDSFKKYIKNTPRLFFKIFG